MTEGYAALAKQVTDCQAAIAKFSTPPAVDADAMKATLKEINDKLAAVTADQAKLKKERALLGFRGTPIERAQLASGTAEDIEKLNATKKSYLELVTDRAATDKCSRAEAHNRVQKTDEGRAAYQLHLDSKGVTGRTTMAA